MYTKSSGGKMISEGFVRRLSNQQREMLIDHIDRSVPINNQTFARGGAHATRDTLITHKLLKGMPSGASRPLNTVLTEDGRMAVALILAGYADALVAAGLLEDPSTGERPIEVLKRMKAERRDPLAGALQAAQSLSEVLK